MAIDVRVARDGERAAAFQPLWHYFGRVVTDEDVERLSGLIPSERIHVAYVDGAAVGGAGAYLLEMTVPGPKTMPVAGVMAVGVLPTHRRQGVLTELMRAQLGAIHERGEALAMLYASEGGIYGRYGYGIASFQGEFRLDHVRAQFHAAAEPVGAVRILTTDEALAAFPPVYERIRVETPGMFARSPDWWQKRRLSRPLIRPGGEPACVLLELDGRPQAYAIYRLDWGIEHNASTTTMHVVEALGETPVATGEIWRFLLGVDWVETITSDFLPLDHPLFFLLREPRRLRFTIGEALWVRLVDVGAALSGRAYQGDGAVVLEVRDEHCPWNAGRWRLEGGAAGRVETKPDLALDVRELGSTYFGAVSFAQLLRAGRIDELSNGGAERADTLFRADRLPWCPEIF